MEDKCTFQSLKKIYLLEGLMKVAIDIVEVLEVDSY